MLAITTLSKFTVSIQEPPLALTDILPSAYNLPDNVPPVSGKAPISAGVGLLAVV